MPARRRSTPSTSAAVLAERCFDGADRRGVRAGTRQLRPSAGHGLRLSLSLAGAPALLSVPWEFLYRRPRFLASQRQPPARAAARHGDAAAGRRHRLDGAHPRRHRQPARPRRRSTSTRSAQARRAGRRQGPPARPGAARLARAGDAAALCARPCATAATTSLHYVGHSDFTADGDGVLYLEDADEQVERGRRDAVRQPALGPGPRCGSSCSTRARAPARRSPTRTPGWRRR